MEIEENRTYMDLSLSRAPKKNHEAMAQKPVVKTAAPASDEASIIDVLLRAFAVDPAARWAWSDPKQYFIHFPSFVKAFGGNAFAYRSAYYVEGYAGAALWLPPNIQPNEDALTSILRNTVPEQIQNEAFEVFERMGRYHPSRIGICRSWVSTLFNREKDLAQRYCNTHLSSAIATASLPILNLQMLRISHCIGDTALSYLVPFR